MVGLLPLLLAAQLVPIRGELRPYRSEQVYSDETGFVERIRVNSGDKVSEGDVLAEVFRDVGEKPYEVRAPFAGVVTAIHVVTGARVGPGMRRHAASMFDVAELHRLRIVAAVPHDVPSGRKIDFRSGKREGAGVLERVSARAGLRIAEIVVDNGSGVLKAGDFVELLWPDAN